MPAGFDISLIPPFLDQKKTWLQRTIKRMEAEYVDTESNEPPALITLPAIREQWHVKYHTGRSGCHEQRGLLSVRHGHEDDWHRPLQRWLSRTAKSILPLWLDEVSQETGLEYNKVTIRAQRTRWGSCSSNGTISLNRGLLFLSPELVHYLIVHELCHTRHMNHSPHYWELVAEYLPEYKSRDRALRHAFPSIPLWARS